MAGSSTTDYETAVALRNGIYSDTQTTVEIWKHNDMTRRQEPSYHFFVAEEVGGPMVAFAQCAKLHAESNTFGIGLVGRSTTWQNGVMGELLTWVKQTAETYKIKNLVQKVQESDQLKLDFLLKSGFKQVMRYPLSALNLAEFDDAKFELKLARTAEFGIQIKRLPDGWHHQLEWQQIVHNLDWQMMQDVPHHEVRYQDTLEDFLEKEIFHPNAWPESYFVAWDGEEPVGLTCFVMRGGKRSTVSTAITGVLRSHRRKGIATALKVVSINFAKAQGCQTILTNNEENNPMYLLNQQLGFSAKPAWLDLKLSLQAE